MSVDVAVVRDRVLEEIRTNRYHSSLDLSRKLGVPEQIVIECLPETAFKRLDVDRFFKVMEDVPDWGDMVLIVKSDSAMMEVRGPVPKGAMGKRYYNLMSPDLSAHIKISELGAVFFVTQESLGRESFSIQFYDLNGNAMFKIFVPRKPDGELSIPQKRRYVSLMERL